MHLTLRIPTSPSTQTLVLEIPLFAPRVGKVYWKHLTSVLSLFIFFFFVFPGLLFLSVFFFGFSLDTEPSTDSHRWSVNWRDRVLLLAG